MKSSTKINCIILALLFALQTQAQDVIYKKNGKEIRVTIVELGTGEIKYRLFDQPEGPVYAEERENIQKIVFRDGRTEFYGTTRMDDAQLFEGQKKSALKISFLGPLIGYTDLIYEHNIKPGRSWEAKAVIIGLGKQYEDEARGFIGTAAYKFYKKPTFYTGDMKRTHLLQGAYIKPEVFLGHSSYIDYGEDDFSITFGNEPEPERKSSVAGGLLLNFGKEWVFDNAFVLDLGIGFGYGTGSSTRSIYVLSDNDVGFAMTWALNIGWVIK